MSGLDSPEGSLPSLPSAPGSPKPSSPSRPAPAVQRPSPFHPQSFNLSQYAQTPLGDLSAESPPFDHPDLGSRSSSSLDYFTTAPPPRAWDEQSPAPGEVDDEVQAKTAGGRTPAGLSLLLGPGMAGLASTRVGLGSPKIDFGRMGRHRPSASPSEESAPLPSSGQGSPLVGVDYAEQQQDAEDQDEEMEDEEAEEAEDQDEEMEAAEAEKAEDQAEEMQEEPDVHHPLGYSVHSVHSGKSGSVRDEASGLPSPPATTSEVSVPPRWRHADAAVGKGRPLTVRQALNRDVSDLPSLPSVSRQVTSSTISDIYHISPDRSPSPALPSLPSMPGSRRSSFRPASSRRSSSSSMGPAANALSSSRGSRSPSKRYSLDSYAPAASPGEIRRAGQLVQEDLRSPHSRSSGSPIKSPPQRSPIRSTIHEEEFPVLRPVAADDPTGDELDARIRAAEEKIRSSFGPQRRTRTATADTYTPTRTQPRRNDSFRQSYNPSPIPDRMALPVEDEEYAGRQASPSVARAGRRQRNGTMTTASASVASPSVRTPMDRLPSEEIDLGGADNREPLEWSGGSGERRLRKPLTEDFFTPPKTPASDSSYRPLGMSSARRPLTAADMRHSQADSPSRPRYSTTSRLSREYVPQVSTCVPEETFDRSVQSQTRDARDVSFDSGYMGRRAQSVLGFAAEREGFSYAQNRELGNGYTRRLSRLNIDPSDSISVAGSRSPAGYTPTRTDPMEVLRRLDQSRHLHNQEWEAARSMSVLGVHTAQPRSPSRFGQSSRVQHAREDRQDHASGHMRASTSMGSFRDTEAPGYPHTAPFDRRRHPYGAEPNDSPLLHRIGSRLRDGSVRDGPASEPRPRRSHTSLETGRSGSSYGTGSSATTEHGRLLYETMRSVDSRLSPSFGLDVGRAVHGSTESTVRVNNALRDALNLASQLAIDVELNPALVRDEFNALIALLKTTTKDSDKSVRDLTQVLQGLPKLMAEPGGSGGRSTTSMSLRHSSVRRSESGLNPLRAADSPLRRYTPSMGGSELYDSQMTSRQSADALRSSTSLASIPSPLVGRATRSRESMPRQPQFEHEGGGGLRRSATVTLGENDRSGTLAGIMNRLRRSPKKDGLPSIKPSPSPPHASASSRSPTKAAERHDHDHPYTTPGHGGSHDSLLSTRSGGTGDAGTSPARPRGLGFWTPGKGLLRKKESSSTVRGHGGFQPSVGQAGPTTAISQITAEPISPAGPMFGLRAARGNRSDVSGEEGGIGTSWRSAQLDATRDRASSVSGPVSVSPGAAGSARVTEGLGPDWTLTPGQMERRARETTPGTTSVASYRTAPSPGDGDDGLGRTEKRDGGGAAGSRRASRGWGPEEEAVGRSVSGQWGTEGEGRAVRELSRLGSVRGRVKRS